MDFFPTQTNMGTVPIEQTIPTWYDGVNTGFQNQPNMMQPPVPIPYPGDIQNNGNMRAEQMVPAIQQPPVEHINTAPYPGPLSMYLNRTSNFQLTMYPDDPNTSVTYAPCQGPRPWNYAQCYGFYGEPPCPLVNLVDMEDFMWVYSLGDMTHIQMSIECDCVRVYNCIVSYGNRQNVATYIDLQLVQSTCWLD